MRIQEKYNTVQLFTLSPGHVFRFCDVHYIMSNESGSPTGTILCVRLRDGTVKRLDVHSPVVPVPDAEMIVPTHTKEASE